MFIHTIAKPNAGKERKMASKYSNITVKGFRRENGRVGVRNHGLILPGDDISNAACEAVANNVKVLWQFLMHTVGCNLGRIWKYIFAQ